MKKPLDFDRGSEAKRNLHLTTAPRLGCKQKNAGLYKKRRKG